MIIKEQIEKLIVLKNENKKARRNHLAFKFISFIEDLSILSI